MGSLRHFYLMHLQYLGFRYHGWQKQPGVRTVEEMVSRTIKYVLGHSNFKILSSGRTDAMVSASVAMVELYLDDEPLETEVFFENMNHNLPADIRLTKIEPVAEDFNIITTPKTKTYHYLFAFGEKAHPYAAPFVTTLADELDLDLMQEGAQLFVGTHDFRCYAYKAKPETQTILTVDVSCIERNTDLSASFFPEETFTFKIMGKGFKRHQVRLMMGVLFDLGEGKIDLHFIRNTLQPNNDIHLDRIAPASGLHLWHIEL